MFNMLLYVYARILTLTLCWTAAQQAPKSMEFSSQEYWSGLTFTTPGDLPNLGIELTSSALEGGFFTTMPPRKPSIYNNHEQYIHYIYRTLFTYILM